jgi:hypothetical protein
MDLEEVLAILLGWIGQDIEIGTHGANGAPPVAALEARGILRKGEEFGSESRSSGVIAFRFEDSAGNGVASLRLYESSFAGGRWFDDGKEVLEIRSGVIQILVATILDSQSGSS